MKQIFPFFLFFIFSSVTGQVTLDFLGQLEYSNNTSDIWGFEKNGSEYAVVTLTNGTSFVDVTDPSNPVELFFVSGPGTLWRDAKDLNSDYVYVVNEAGGGLRIFDLTSFPENLSHTNWTGGNFQGQNINLNDAHNVFIDENGYGYIIGYSNTEGVIIIDLNGNPLNPTIVGIYDNNYVHDVFVRGDTMWTCEFNNGYFAVVDVSNKANPNIMAIQSTPGNATHNIWLSDDGNYAFTSDETFGGKVVSWDVSDLSDIQLLDDYVSSHPNPSTPHNAFVKGDYLYISHYEDGAVAIDISNPYNLTEVAHYDSSTDYTGQGFEGCWGIYPYLPSGNVLITDQQNGLFILEGEPIAPSAVSVSLKVLLQGPYMGGGIMENSLLIAGVLPLQHPYGAAPYNYNFTNTITNLPIEAVDWVLVEARAGTPTLSGNRMTVTVETQAGLLLQDGTIVGEDGLSPLRFENLTIGQAYHFCVRHRNHIDVLTNVPLIANSTTLMTYDFTSGIGQAFGPFQQTASNDGYALLFGGEYTQDGTIQNTDYDAWQSQPALLDVYISIDGNLDGVSQTSDYDVWFPNKAKIGSVEIGF